MVTVGKELSTHLYRETEYFSGHLWVSPLVKKCMLPARGDEPDSDYSADGESHGAPAAGH